MIQRHTYKGLVWVDLETPTPDEVRDTIKEFGVYPPVADELVNPTLKPKVDLYQNCIYLILHFPAIDHHNPKGSRQEIDFIIGKDFLITTHYDSIDPLHRFSKVFEVRSILEKGEHSEHAGFIFYSMIKEMYSFLLEELEYVRDSLHEAEERVFKGEEKEMVFTLSNINREILDFKNATSMHKEVLTSFSTAGKKFFGSDFEYYLEDIMSEYYKVHNGILNSKEFLEELRVTNDALLSTKQNETMKVFTVMAFVFLPLTFVSSIFGMSMSSPLINSLDDFYKVLGGMFLLCIITFLLFKYKRWL